MSARWLTVAAWWLMLVAAITLAVVLFGPQQINGHGRVLVVVAALLALAVNQARRSVES